MPEIPNRLRKILDEKQPEIDRLRSSGLGEGYRSLAKGGAYPYPATPSLIDAIGGDLADGRLYAILEHKRASPSKGPIRPDSDPVDVARTYEAAGAAAISVLTDSHFDGTLDDLRAVKAAVGVPVLRKDFITDEYQVYESRAAGADAVLLIRAAVPDIGLLRHLYNTIRDCRMDCLMEVHSLQELEDVLEFMPQLIGINNRNLTSFEVSPNTTLGLLPYVPDGFLVVTESGITTRKDVERYEGKGIRAMLIGEAVMKADDMKAKIAELGIRPRKGYRPDS